MTRSGTHVARSTEKITLDDLNDSAAVNTYIANLIRNGLLTTRNELQLLLDDNLTKKQLVKAYIQLGYGITKTACEQQFSKAGMVQLHVVHYESIYPTSLRSSADEVVKGARERAKSIVAGEYVTELHLINYDINNPRVAENWDRIIGPNDDRSTCEEDWSTHKTWDKMFMHSIDE